MIELHSMPACHVQECIIGCTKGEEDDSISERFISIMFCEEVDAIIMDLHDIFDDSEFDSPELE